MNAEWTSRLLPAEVLALELHASGRALGRRLASGDLDLESAAHIVGELARAANEAFIAADRIVADEWFNIEHAPDVIRRAREALPDIGDAAVLGSVLEARSAWVWNRLRSGMHTGDCEVRRRVEIGRA